MKVSELLADLNNRPQTGQVLMVETDVTVGPGNIFTIESIAGGNEKSVILMGKSVTRKPLDEMFSNLIKDREQGRWTRIFKAEIHKSEKDGKYEVSINGRIMQSGFETVEEAKLFARGFAFGFELGSAGKGLNPADLSGS
jgi:hypothetical protein